MSPLSSSPTRAGGAGGGIWVFVGALSYIDSLDCAMYRTRDEYDTKNRQHVRLIWNPFIDWLCKRENGLSYAPCPTDASYVCACASARFRERCIVPIDVLCMSQLYVHVWVRHTGLVHRWHGNVARHEEDHSHSVNRSIHSVPYPWILNSICITNKYFLYNLQTLSVVLRIVPRSC